MIRFKPARLFVSIFPFFTILFLSNVVLSKNLAPQHRSLKLNSVRAALPTRIYTRTLGATAPVAGETMEPDGSAVSPLKGCDPNCGGPTSGTLALNGKSMSDDKAGSLLLYNIYTSDPTGAQDQDTALSLTNIGPLTVYAHLFLIDGQSCSVADFYATFTASQTTRWLASELDPGVTGYALAVAVNEEGAPISYNYLIGATRVKFKAGHMASLSAESFAALYPYNTILPGFVSGAQTAELMLDGTQYNQAPLILSADNIASPQDKNSALLIVNPVGGDLSSSSVVNTIGSLAGQLYDEVERGYSFQAPQNVCQVRQEINDSFIRVPGRFSKIISSSHCGTVRFWEIQGKSLSGAIINFNPDVLTAAQAYNQGHNLHTLTISDQAKYIIPIYRPQS